MTQIGLGAQKKLIGTSLIIKNIVKEWNEVDRNDSNYSLVTAVECKSCGEQAVWENHDDQQALWYQGSHLWLFPNSIDSVSHTVIDYWITLGPITDQNGSCFMVNEFLRLGVDKPELTWGVFPKYDLEMRCILRPFFAKFKMYEALILVRMETDARLNDPPVNFSPSVFYRN